MSYHVAISVVLTVYNGERFLALAVESILAQTWRDFELIAVDDGSTDGSLTILQAYAAQDRRVRVLACSNTGQAGALNTGVAAARGAWVARMDADDIAAPERLRRQADFLAAHLRIGAVGAAYQAIDESGSPLGRPKLFSCDPAVIRKELQRGCCALAHPTVMIRRDVLQETGAYRGLLRPAEDYDLWLRMSEIADLANLPDVLLQYRIHGGSLSIKFAVAQALGTEVARRAGMVRRRTGADPIRDETSITPELLKRVGLSADEVSLLHGQTLRCLASNHLLRGNLSAALASIAEYEGAEIAPWVRRRLAPEFELLQTRIQRMQGDLTPLIAGVARICGRHPQFLIELAAKAVRRFRQ